MSTSPYSLDRNDVPAAVRCFNAAVAEGATKEALEGLAQVLIQLQDDPAELLRRLPRRK